MPRSLSRTHAPKTGGVITPSRPAPHPPAKIMYITLRQRHGLSHEAATHCLRETLKGYFKGP